MLDFLFYTFMAITAIGVLKFVLQLRAARLKAIMVARRAHVKALYEEAAILQEVARKCRSTGDHDGAHACHRAIDGIYRGLRLPL
jgi:hypothetical protein